MFLKRKYRKIVYEITKKEKTFSKSNVINSIQLLHLKLNSAFQIVNKKLIKYLPIKNGICTIPYKIIIGNIYPDYKNLEESININLQG